MKLLEALSLRQMLTLPYVVLVLLAALALGALSYRAGHDTVDTLSGQLITEMVGRISQAVEKHVSGSSAVLETAFPNGMPGPARVADHIDELRTRFWLATSVHRDLNNYAYYGDREGHFFGLWRHSDTEAELRLRTAGTGPRAIHRFTGIAGPLGPPAAEQRVFEPRERPWFKAGQQATLQTWTSIYIDFKTLELVATRARRVPDAQGAFQGVVATDLSLQRLNEFLRTLPLSSHGTAFIVERDGNLIATSRGPHLTRGAQGDNQRLNAADSGDPMIAATWREVRTVLAASRGTQAQSSVFDLPGGGAVQLGWANVRDAAGLDWIIAVAVPRSDFLADVTASLTRSALLAVAMAGLIALLGFAVLAVVSRDLKRLALAARQVGEGQLDAPLAVDRRDEIGELAKAFQAMQRRLHTDRLTGLANREAFMRRIDDRIVQHRRRGDERPFAVMFVDLNKFKQINDTWGHDVGDQVLRVLAQRLRGALRSEDLAARYAGDEFVVLVGGVAGRADAEAARTHLEQALAEPVVLDAPGAQIVPGRAGPGAAIGLAMFPEDGRDVDALVKHADRDMYERKRAGAAPP